MPTADNLIGMGVPPLLAQNTGNTPSALTATGTAQGTAATIKSTLVEITTASSNTGAILPADALMGTPYWAYNVAAPTAVVYVPSGHYLNGTQNAGLSVATNKAAVLIQYKKGYWASILTA